MAPSYSPCPGPGLRLHNVTTDAFRELNPSGSRIMLFALAGVAQWIEHRFENQGVSGLIPSQGTGLGCEPGPQ